MAGRRWWVRRATVVALVFALVRPMIPASAATSLPVVRGPISGGIWGHPLFDSFYLPKAFGYRQDEYFISGRASSAADRTKTAPFTTRMIVSRPLDPKRFNGTVVLDWTNVTAQFENPVDILETREMLMREGFAFVHVSAQSAGVCCNVLTPKGWDPVRYASLKHPGDAYALNMFTQVARSFRARKGPDPMHGLKVAKVLAVGQSQSASELYSYVNSEEPRARAIDGFLIHGGGSKHYPHTPPVPVLNLSSDLEADAAKPNVTKNYRLWEVAGAAHSDFWIGYQQVFGQGPRAVGQMSQLTKAEDEGLRRTAGNYGGEYHPMGATCVVAGAMFPMHYVASAAIHSLDRWVKTGVAPPNGPRFKLDATGMVARDANYNTLGGIRLPPIAVPVATYVSTVCGLGGITIPFSPVQLAQLYPRHADYYAKMQKATAASVKAGFLLPPDAVDLLHRACRAKVPSPVLASSNCETG